MHGKDLWMNDTSYYDALVKIEPTFRALADLDVKVWITGRRRSQGDQRSDLQVLEVQRDGRIKINPLAHWSYSRTLEYARAHGVYYNPLFDRGYKSVGDVMTTHPVEAHAPERSGRWAGQLKSECGMHNSQPGDLKGRRRASVAPVVPTPTTENAPSTSAAAATTTTRAEELKHANKADRRRSLPVMVASADPAVAAPSST